MWPGRGIALTGVLSFALLFTLALTEPAAAKRMVGTNRANKLVGTAQRDEIVGRGGKDVILGGRLRDRLYGDEGDDVILGEAGNDRLWGGGRDDTLDGGTGRDRIWAGWGTDVVDAGRGNDIVYASENDVSVDSIDCGPGYDRAVVNRADRVFNCERVTRLRGRRVPGRFWVGKPDVDDERNDSSGHFRDFLVGLGGDDSLFGHAFPDMLWGNDDDDYLNGGHGPDRLIGGPGDDTFEGGGGDDRLWGGGGIDTLTGNEHNDEIISISADRAVDVIDCGRGRDRVVARTSDKVAKDCNRVIRIR